MKNRKTKKGFTIVELVIVIAVIGILSAILIPTFVNLTNDAQKAARKQQASDAYTAYMTEAVDGKHDSYLDRSGSEPSYIYADVAIAQKSQAQVAINFENNGVNYWFTYDAEKGWQEGTSQPDGYTNAVVAARETGHVFVNADKTAVAEGFNNLKASTFNNSVVYYK